MAGQPWDGVLHKFSHHASRWAKEQGVELYVGALTMARMGRPKYRRWPMPVLDTRVKAGNVGTLLAFWTFIMARLVKSTALDAGQQLQAQFRATCLWALDTALSAWSVSQTVCVRDEEVREIVWMRRLHSACYQWLAAQSLSRRRLLYKVMPKSHYFVHMVDGFERTKINSMNLSAFSDEDFMGKMRRLCQACSGKTYMVAWSRRYALNRALQWMESRKSKVNCARAHGCVCVCLCLCV